MLEEQFNILKVDKNDVDELREEIKNLEKRVKNLECDIMKIYRKDINGGKRYE